MELANEDPVTTSTETNHLNGLGENCSSTCVRHLQSNEQKHWKTGELKAPSVQSDISTIVQVFKNIYEQRIAAIDRDDKLDRNGKNEEKLGILQQYIQQLLDQNDTFVSTMMELETEAQLRVKQMEKRLKSTAKTTMDMQPHLSAIKVENGFLRDQNCNLNHDVQALLHIIHHARSTGHWEMDCVTFCEVTPEQVFGPVQSLSAIYASESPQSDFISYEDERKAHNCSTSSPCISQFVKIRDTDSNTHFHSGGHQNEPLEKDKKILLLQSQISELRHQLTIRDAECECHIWKLEMLMQQTKNRVQTAELLLSGASLPKCISLPDIGNIYHFSNAVRKSYSYGTYSNTKTLGIKLFSSNNINCGKTGPHISEFQKCKSVLKKSEHNSGLHRGQSEPHLFMFGDNVYVYRPCESIKKASNIALLDDYEISLPPCQSIDLKFPTEDSDTKICKWASSDQRGSYNVPDRSYSKDCETGSSCSCTDTETESFNKETYVQNPEERVSSSVQTEIAKTYSIGLQADVKISADKIKDGGFSEMDIPLMISSMQLLKENLIKAEDKAEAKVILLEQLQGHLTSAVKEVELKDTALNNVEKKLDVSRKECTSLKQQMHHLNSDMKNILKELDDTHVLNENLKLKADVKEEKIQEILSQQRMLQEQKRTLLTQLDAQGDDLEKNKEELDIMKHKAESFAVQVEQQNQIIRSLQDALVQSKRAFDATHQKMPLSHAVSSSSFHSETKASSKCSVVDI